MRVKLFGLSVLASLMVPAALASADDRIPVLHVAGRAYDAQNQPLRDGRAWMLLDTSGSGTNTGRLPFVGKARVKDGRFDLIIRDAELPAPISPYGARDFLVFVDSRDGRQVFEFTTRGLNQRAANGEPAAGVEPSSDIPPPSIPKPGEIVLPIKPPQLPFKVNHGFLGINTYPVAGIVDDTRATYDPSGCQYSIESSFTQPMVFSQLHGYEAINARFGYATTKTADSVFGVAVQGPYGWSAGGTSSAFKSSVANAGLTITDKSDIWVSGHWKTNVMRVRDVSPPPPGTANCGEKMRYTKTNEFQGEMKNAGAGTFWLHGTV